MTLLKNCSLTRLLLPNRSCNATHKGWYDDDIMWIWYE